MTSREKLAVRFQEVPESEDSSMLEEQMHHLQQPQPRQRQISRTQLNIWKSLTFMFACTTLLQIPFSNIWTLSTYEHGFTTDFAESERADRLVERRFSFPIRATPEGALFVPVAHQSPDYPLPGQFSDDADDAARYVGPPSEERDRAWEELTGPRYFGLTPNDREHLDADSVLNATQALPATEQRPLAAAYAGVDVLHSLHCLDALRRRIDRADFASSSSDNDAYKSPPSTGPDESPGSPFGAAFERMHVEHCINQLRESVMCHADTTPVTLLPVSVGADITVLLGETERLHTCRDFGRVRDWVRERVGERGSAV